MDHAELQRRLNAQNFRCAYPHDDDESAALVPGQLIALAYDNHGIVHLDCANVGVVPVDHAGQLKRFESTLVAAMAQGAQVAVDVLRSAILVHKRAMEDAGPLGLEAEFTRDQVAIMHAKHEADLRLWSLLG